MLKQLRVNVIKGLVELNEKLVFNKRLIKYYKRELSLPLNNVIDVGVNTGQFIDIFKSINKNCSIHGFEPIQTCSKC